jgi:hypothetical protein
MGIVARMDTIRLAYRDTDRSPIIFCIKELAARHYDLNVEVLFIAGTEEYEAAIFEDASDLICEHLEYLFAEYVQRGRKSVMFLSPVAHVDNNLVVGPEIKDLSDLKGRRIAVRTFGRPYEVTMQVRALGLEGSVELVPVSDAEVGRWSQWRKIVSGECAATFIRCLQLPPALEAGLHTLPAPRLEIVGHFHHACSAEYARTHDDVLDRYVRAAIHALCLMKLRRDEALDIVAGESARLMGLENDRPELERAFDCIVGQLQVKPFPTPAGIANSYEIACDEWPGGKGMNPMVLWDLHWLKQLEDEGFIDNLIAKMKG